MSESFPSTSSSSSSAPLSSYTDRSLDELRYLSDSVDSGRIEAMQQGFSGVAEQVSGVVDQLVALRRDLPSWWEGIASDGTLEHFDAVISHAQSTQSMAAGASAALKTCVSVVREEQAAMSGVPEVFPPALGVEGAATAAEAAKAAANYSAAQARAAGIVQGIGAQFVETTAQLGGVGGTNYDRGFQKITSPSGGRTSFAPVASATSSHHQTTTQLSNMTFVTPTQRREVAIVPVLNITVPPVVEDPIIAPWIPYVGDDPVSPDTVPADPVPADLDTPISGIEFIPGSGSQLIPFQETTPGVVPIGSATDPGAVQRVDASSGMLHETEDPNLKVALTARPSTAGTVASRTGTSRRGTSPTSASEKPTIVGPTSSVPESHTMDERMMGPIGAGTHAPIAEDKEHTKRPDYLKDQNSWRPNAIMAPAGGLLTPDWAEEQ